MEETIREVIADLEKELNTAIVKLKKEANLDYPDTNKIIKWNMEKEKIQFTITKLYMILGMSSRTNKE